MTIEQKKLPFKKALMVFGAIGILAMGGCSTTAVKYDASNVSDFTDSTLRSQAVPLETDEPLNIDNVRARTLAHNSEYARAQTQLMETVRKAGILCQQLWHMEKQCECFCW